MTIDGAPLDAPMDSPILELLNVEASYGAVTAIRGVSLRVRKGEIATVLGANGAGKTTIMRTISGIIDPTKGRILFKGEDITGKDPARIVRMGLSHVPEGREIFPLLSVYDNLVMGAFTRRDRAGVRRASTRAVAAPRAAGRDLHEAGLRRSPDVVRSGHQITVNRAP